MSVLLGGSDSLINSTIPFSDYPCTINVWYKTSNVTNGQSLVGMGEVILSTNYMAVNCQGNAGGDPNRAAHRHGAIAQKSADTAVAYDTDTWAMATGVFRARDWIAILKNGANKVTNTDDTGPSLVGDFNDFCIGALYSGSRLNYTIGRIAEVAIWDIELPDSDVAKLYSSGKANDARNVRPGNLVFYAPLKDSISAPLIGASLSADGTPSLDSDHPVVVPYGTVTRTRAIGNRRLSAALVGRSA